MRAAQFLVPSVEAGKFPPLPEKPDTGLSAGCQLAQLWYETEAKVDSKDVVQWLKSRLGEPNGPPEEYRLKIWGGGWGRKTAWHKDGIAVWVVSDPRKGFLERSFPGGLGHGLTMAVYVRSDVAPDRDWESTWDKLQALVAEQSGPALAETAAMEPSLTKSVLARTRCANWTAADVDVAVDPDGSHRWRGFAGDRDIAEGVDRLGRWLDLARALPPGRRAAALLVADYYVTCAQQLDLQTDASVNRDFQVAHLVSEQYAKVGAVFHGCPLGGYVPYGHSFRTEASSLSPETLRDLADLHAFWERDAFGYEKAGTGERLARALPEWRPVIHNALARAHELRIFELSRPGRPPLGEIRRVFDYSRAEMRRERDAAVRDYVVFIRENPSDPESANSWQRAWRMLAGLAPASVSAGPGDCE
jgi:hypothetical protein